MTNHNANSKNTTQFHVREEQGLGHLEVICNGRIMIEIPLAPIELARLSETINNSRLVAQFMQDCETLG